MRTRWPTDGRFPWLSWEGDPDNPRIKLKKPGCRVTVLKARPWFGPAFEAEYNAAAGVVSLPRIEKRRLRANGAEPIKRPGGPRSLNALLKAYFEGDHWNKGLGDATRTNWRYLLEATMQMKTQAGHPVGAMPYLLMDFYKVSKIYKSFAARHRGKAVNWLTAFSAVWTWAMESEFDRAIKVNPCRGIKRVGAKGKGHLTWQPELIEHVLAGCAEGSEMHNLVTGVLYTGARGSDFRLINDDMIVEVEDDLGNARKMITFEPVKNRERKLREGKEITPAFIPILPPLQKLLDARPPGQSHLFVTRLGRVVTRGHIGRKLRDYIRSLEWGGEPAPKLTAHGLRKACTMFLLQSKPTPSHEDIAAIMGWKDVRMVAYYAQDFDRERGALRAMPSFAIPRARRQRPQLRVVSS